MFTLLTAMNVHALMTGATPHVGDIVAFSASSAKPAGGGTRLVAQRTGQHGCVLDLTTLRHFGGSLIVEGQSTEAAGRYRVHWAGNRTTTGAGNCGESTDLILDARDMKTLASSAGG